MKLLRTLNNNYETLTPGEDFNCIVAEISKEEYFRIYQNNDFIGCTLYSGATPLLPREVGRYGDARLVLSEEAGADRSAITMTILGKALGG